MISIDIYSDTICPWCFIGKRRLERALAKRPVTDVRITWRAFQLNPAMPAGGLERGTYIRLKFGGRANADRIYERVKVAGDDEDIPFEFERIRITPNTLDSHRLLRFASDFRRQGELAEALFVAYFLDARNIGDRDELSAIAGDCGLDRESVRNFLMSERFAEDIRREDEFARLSGVQGVPCFIFNGRHAVSGAQPVEVFQQLLDLAAQDVA